MKHSIIGTLLLTSMSALAQDIDFNVSSYLSGAATSPACIDHGQALPVNNQQVITWKHSTVNQFLARAHVLGTVTRLYPDHNGHTHFEIQLAPTTDGTIEIVYNQSFGALPNLSPGMTVEACGDYITSIAQSGPYPASPDGAILHWVHRNPSGQGHDSGYLVINGLVCGQGNGSGALQ